MAGIRTAEVRTGLRLVTVSWMLGIWWQFVVNGAPLAVTTGAVMAVFGQRIGFGDFHFGLLAMLPFLGTLAQLLGSMTVERRRQRKSTFLWWMTHNRWPWVLVALAPFVLDSTRLVGCVLLLIGLTYVCGGMGHPAWMSWMSDFVPRRRRGRFFSLRAQYAMASLLVVTVLVGGGLDWAERRGPDALLVACSAFLLLAALCGTLDIQLFRGVPEPRMAPYAESTRWRDVFAEPLGNRPFRTLLMHNMALTFAMTLLGPFLMLHCLSALAFSKLWASVLLGLLVPLGYMTLSQRWGRTIDRWGRRPILTVSMLLSTITAAGWLLAGPGDIWLVAPVCFLTGAFWSGMETANLSLTLHYTGGDRANGSSFQAMLALAISVAGLAGGLVAGAAAEMLSEVAWQIGPMRLNNYMILLAASIAVRALDLLLVVPRLEDHGAFRTGHTVRLMAGEVVGTVRRRLEGASDGPRAA